MAPLRDTLKLTDRKVLDQAHTCPKAHLPLQAEGYTCTTDDLLSVPPAVATQRGTVESVCADLAGTPDPETIRIYFKEQLRLEDLPALGRGVNAALPAEIPFRVWRPAREVAIDFRIGPTMGRHRKRRARGCGGELVTARPAFTGWPRPM